jgi:hypothetical protein
LKSELIASGMNKVELAQKHFERLGILRGVHGVVCLEVGELCYTMNKNKEYKVLGYDSMGEMLADPEINTFAVQTIRDYMSIYKKFELEMGIERDTLNAIGPHRLKLIAGRVKDDPETWLTKAKELSRSDLIIEVKGEVGQPHLMQQHGGKATKDAHPSPLSLTIDEYKDWVREQPCCVCGIVGQTHYAHWPVTNQNSDFGIPLCFGDHMWQEEHQEEFFRLYRRNVAKYLEGLFRNE